MNLHIKVAIQSSKYSWFDAHEAFLVHEKEMDGVRYSCLVSPKVNEREEDFFSTKQEGLPSILLNRSCLYLRSATPNELASCETLNNGNEEPYRGFGHIAFNCNDVYKSCSRLEQEGVKFRKRPDEGRMKGLAFCLDPDGYFIEICQRGSSPRPEPFNLSQTMIRVKDPKKSIAFYGDVLGMVLVREMHMSDFSNYFMASLPPNIDPNEYSTEKQRDFVHSLWNPCLELTHNHGTEDDSKFSYHNGNQPPRVGFSHLSFHAEDLQSLEKAIENGSYHVKKCGGGLAKSLDAFWLEDPDGYTIEIIPRRSFNVE